MNKIDAAEDISSLVKYVQDMTGFNYRVEPISSKTGEGIDRLRKAIMDILKKESKDILFAKSIKEKSSTANNWILAAAASAAGIGAVPLPGADIIPLTGIQVALMLRLATLYEKPISKDRAKELILSSLTGSLGKTIFRQAVKLIPGAGSVAAGGVAGSLTLGLGFAVKYAYENNIELDADILKSLTSIFKKQKPIFEGASI